MVAAVVVLAVTVLVAGSRLRWSLAAYVVFTATALWLEYGHVHTIAQMALFAFMGAFKIVAGPLALALLARRYGVPRDLAASVSIVWRILAAIAIAFLAFEIGRMPAFAGVPFADVVFFAIFASLLIVVLHRNLLAHVIGLLALGSAISLAGSVFAAGLPGSVELADTFDALVATFVALLVARAIVGYDPRLDMRSLRELRG